MQGSRRSPFEGRALRRALLHPAPHGHFGLTVGIKKGLGVCRGHIWRGLFLHMQLRFARSLAPRSMPPAEVDDAFMAVLLEEEWAEQAEAQPTAESGAPAETASPPAAAECTWGLPVQEKQTYESYFVRRIADNARARGWARLGCAWGGTHKRARASPPRGRPKKAVIGSIFGSAREAAHRRLGRPTSSRRAEATRKPTRNNPKPPKPAIRAAPGYDASVTSVK